MTNPLRILDDPQREGLAKTPQRVIDSWDELFAGYNLKAADLLDSTFNGEGYARR